jgi:putative acetyltransferase
MSGTLSEMREKSWADFVIRPERPSDHDAIRAVNDAAFGQPAEGELVDALRQTAAFIPELSLVAEQGTNLIGHILFTSLTVVEERAVHPALALAPMAVVPSWQRRGVGSALVRRGLQDARVLGHAVVIVLGHPHYYPRFGFRPARPLGIRSPFDAPDEAFLALELQPGALQAVHGEVKYPPAFLTV